MYVVFLTVLVFSPILCGASCECNRNVMDCRTDGMSAVKLEGCTEARSVFVRGFCVGLVDHRGSTLDSITLFESSMSCEDLTAAVDTKTATVNGKPCQVPLKLKTQQPRPPAFPVEPDANNEDDNGNNGGNDGGKYGGDDGLGGNNRDGDDSETDYGSETDYDANSTTTESTPQSTTTTTPTIIVVRVSFAWVRWTVVLGVAVVCGGGCIVAVIRVRAVRRQQRTPPIELAEVSSSSPDTCERTYVVSSSMSPRRRRLSMESVILFAVDES